MMSSEIPRVRRATAWVINSIAQSVPDLILKQQNNLDCLIRQMWVHIETDRPQIKHFAGSVMSALFIAAKSLPPEQHSILNPYYHHTQMLIKKNL